MTVRYRRYSEGRAALNTLLTRLERNPVLPLTETPDGFADIGDLLATAHQRWHNHLGARVDAALEAGDPPPEAVRDAYLGTARALPGLRRLLDAYTGHPILTRAEEREWALLAWAAGLCTAATPTSEAARLGRRFRDAARSNADAVAAAARATTGGALSARLSATTTATATATATDGTPRRTGHAGRCRWLRRLRHSVAA